MGRAERREGLIRAKNKVRRHIKDTWYAAEHLADNPKFVGKLANTPHPCSGRCCGNPRRHEKGKGCLTLQELRQKEDLKLRGHV
jgi:hypothetical protein